jgi:hypothetical protein
VVEPLEYGLHRALGGVVVAVEEPDVVAGGHGEPDVARLAEPYVLGQVADPEALVALRVLVEDLAAVIGRGVVNRDHFQPGALGVPEQGLQTLLEVALDPVHGDDHAQ